jgi:hypothetical protein
VQDEIERASDERRRGGGPPQPGGGQRRQAAQDLGRAASGKRDDDSLLAAGGDQRQLAGFGTDQLAQHQVVGAQGRRHAQEPRHVRRGGELAPAASAARQRADRDDPVIGGQGARERTERDRDRVGVAGDEQVPPRRRDGLEQRLDVTAAARDQLRERTLRQAGAADGADHALRRRRREGRGDPRPVGEPDVDHGVVRRRRGISRVRVPPERIRDRVRVPERVGVQLEPLAAIDQSGVGPDDQDVRHRRIGQQRFEAGRHAHAADLGEGQAGRLVGAGGRPRRCGNRATAGTGAAVQPVEIFLRAAVREETDGPRVLVAAALVVRFRGRNLVLFEEGTAGERGRGPAGWRGRGEGTRPEPGGRAASSSSSSLLVPMSRSSSSAGIREAEERLRGGGGGGGGGGRRRDALPTSAAPSAISIPIRKSPT